MKKIIVLSVLFIVVACGAVFMAVREQEKITHKTGISNTTSNQEVSNTNDVVGKALSPTIFKNIPTLADLKLILSNPTETTVSSSTSTVVVSGATLPHTPVIINEFELTSDAAGNFVKTISLDEGDNYISIIAYTSEGASAEREIIVIRTISE